jgi:hypothetical protein
MKNRIAHLLSWCFPLKELEAPWRAVLRLSIVPPPGKQRKKIAIGEPWLSDHHSNAFLAIALSLAITALGTVVVQLFLH